MEFYENFAVYSQPYTHQL